MRCSIRTVVSLTVNITKILDFIVSQLKKDTTYKINKSKVIRVSILYLSSYEETELKKMLFEYKSIVKWQTNKSDIKEINITLNEKCNKLLELMTKIETNYKLYKSGLIRLAITRLSEEKNFTEIFLNFIVES